MTGQISDEPTSSHSTLSSSKIKTLTPLPEDSEKTLTPLPEDSVNIAQSPVPALDLQQVQGGWTDWLTRLFRRTDAFAHYFKQFFAYLLTKLRGLLFGRSSIIYNDVPLSLENQIRLTSVPRKTLILDLDETLLHSCYLDPGSRDFVGCNLVPASAVPDYELQIPIQPEHPPIAMKVYKRPYVDAFLDIVGKWYDVVIYTASHESYASIVVDLLDAGRGILGRRFYRQHCVSSTAAVSKNLEVVNQDLRSVIIVDNSPSAYKDFPKNAIPIKSYIYDPEDTELLSLLPFLDALRFTKDVRSILSRRELIEAVFA